MTFWSCPNGHIVLDAYMPQNGLTCNVVGCGLTRQHYALQGELSGQGRAEVGAALRDVHDAANDLLSLIHGDDLSYSAEAFRVEQMLARACKALWRDSREKLRPVP